MKSPKKKTNKRKKEPLEEILKKKRNFTYPISFFLDPRCCHRVYRDFMIPDFNSSNFGVFTNPIYSFEDFPQFKYLSQCYIREHGLVFQYHDYNPDFITPLGFLQARLNSLGNKFAHDIANFLPKYYEIFQNIEESDNLNENLKIGSEIIKQRKHEPISLMSSTNEKLLYYVDKLLSENKENILLIWISQNRLIDRRIIMLVYNNQLNNLLFMDDDYQSKVFTEDIKEVYYHVFCCFSYEQRMNDILLFLKNFFSKEQLDLGNNTYSRYLNTIFGHIKADFTVKSIEIDIEGNLFNLYCSTIEKNLSNEWIFNLMKNKKAYFHEKEAFVNKKNNHVKLSSDWEKLLKYYFPQILEEKTCKIIK